MFKLFREERHLWQAAGHYAVRLQEKFDGLTKKIREVASAKEAQCKMNFIAVILKVQLAKELEKTEGFPHEKSFCPEPDRCLSKGRRSAGERSSGPSWTQVVRRRPRMPSPGDGGLVYRRLQNRRRKED